MVAASAKSRFPGRAPATRDARPLRRASRVRSRRAPSCVLRARLGELFSARLFGAPPPPRGWREQAIASGRWRAFRAAEWRRTKARSVRRRQAAVARFGSRPTRGLKRLRRRSYYRLQRRKPIDPDLAVFAAYWYRGYSCNPRAIYEKLRELVPHVRGVWVVKPRARGRHPARRRVRGRRNAGVLHARSRGRSTSSTTSTSRTTSSSGRERSTC